MLGHQAVIHLPVEAVEEDLRSVSATGGRPGTGRAMAKNRVADHVHGAAAIWLIRQPAAVEVGHRLTCAGGNVLHLFGCGPFRRAGVERRYPTKPQGPSRRR